MWDLNDQKWGLAIACLIQRFWIPNSSFFWFTCAQHFMTLCKWCLWFLNAWDSCGCSPQLLIDTIRTSHCNRKVRSLQEFEGMRCGLQKWTMHQLCYIQLVSSNQLVFQPAAVPHKTWRCRIAKSGSSLSSVFGPKSNARPHEDHKEGATGLNIKQSYLSKHVILWDGLWSHHFHLGMTQNEVPLFHLVKWPV